MQILPRRHLTFVNLLSSIWEFHPNGWLPINLNIVYFCMPFETLKKSIKQLLTMDL